MIKISNKLILNISGYSSKHKKKIIFLNVCRFSNYYILFSFFKITFTNGNTYSKEIMNIRFF